MIAACMAGDVEKVKELIEEGANVDEEKIFTYPTGDFDRTSGLLEAVKRNHEEIVKILLENGSDPNQEDGMIKTPVHYACEEGNEKIFFLLVEFGGNIYETTYIDHFSCMYFLLGENFNKNIFFYLVDEEACGGYSLDDLSRKWAERCDKNESDDFIKRYELDLA